MIKAKSITNRGTLRFMVFRKKFNADVCIEFLRRLIRDVPRKIFLIVDRHPVHRSAKVRRWLDAHRKQIRLFFLPSYSPELNPDEMLNNDVKSNAVGRRRARTQDEMIENVRSYLWSTQRQPDIVRSYFHAPTVRYAAD
jgi:transposase